MFSKTIDSRSLLSGEFRNVISQGATYYHAVSIAFLVGITVNCATNFALAPSPNVSLNFFLCALIFFIFSLVSIMRYIKIGEYIKIALIHVDSTGIHSGFTGIHDHFSLGRRFLRILLNLFFLVIGYFSTKLLNNAISLKGTINKNHAIHAIIFILLLIAFAILIEGPFFRFREIDSSEHRRNREQQMTMT